MKENIYKDAIFQSRWLSKFISCLFFTGKKWKAEKMIYFSFFCLKYFFIINMLYLFLEILECLKPWIGIKIYHTLKGKRKKIQAYPIILTINTQYKKAIYWLLSSIKLRQELNFCIKINTEIKNIIFNETTNSFKKKKEYYNYAILFKSTQKFKW